MDNDYTVTDMEERLRDEALQPPDVHAQRGRAAFRRLLVPAPEEA